MRIVKEYDERRNELLDTAEMLFISKGYQHTTVNDIREKVGVAKGTFYHYFQSKEEILDAVIDRIIDADVTKAEKVMANAALEPAEKIQQILLSQKTADGEIKKEMTKEVHSLDNAQMHLKTITRSIEKLSPVFACAVEEGIEKGDFHTKYPREMMDLLLICGQMLFEEGVFCWSTEEITSRLEAFVHAMELLLGAKEGSFDFIYNILADK